MEPSRRRDQAVMHAYENTPPDEASAGDGVDPTPSTAERKVNSGWAMPAETKTRLVLLHYTAPPIVGGVEHVIGEQARLFSTHGHAVTVMAGRAGAEQVVEAANLVIVPELDTQNDCNQKVMEALNSGLVLPEFRQIQSRLEQALRANCAGDTALFAHNVLNLHLNLPLTAALHHLLDEGALRRVIAWCHDVSRYVNPTSGAPLRSGFPWDLLRTYRPEVTYVAVSRQRRCILSRVLGCPQEQIRVIPNGIDPEAFEGLGHVVSRLTEEFELMQADLVLLMPTRITRAKNIQRALDIIACLRDMGTRIRLIVTGPPDPHALDGKAYFDGLVTLRHKLGLGHEVVFLWEGLPGMPAPLTIGPAVVAELYRVCDLVLLTSDREGFGLPVLEAGLAGKPIFTTGVPALDEFESGSVFGIARGELPMQVAKRILEWAEQDIPHRLRRQVRRDYSWSEVFRHHIEPLLLESTVSSTVQA